MKSLSNQESELKAGGVDCALGDGLRDEEEVVPLGQRHHVVHDGPRGRVEVVGASLLDELGVDPLVDNDEGKLDVLLLHPDLDQGVLDGLHLVLNHVVDLTVAHAVPEGEM